MGTPGFPESQVGAPRPGGRHGSAPAEVEVYPSRLRCWQGIAPRMPAPHRHDDIEVNLVYGSPLRYLFGGTPVEIRPGQVGVFWATVPHRLLDGARSRDAYVCWLHLPLGIVLHWGLPERAVAAILRGGPLLRRAADAYRMDSGSFGQWAGDLGSGSPERRRAALLEIQAQLRRLMAAAPQGPPAAPSVGADGLPPAGWVDGDEGDDGLRHAAEMARFAATHFREPVTAADVAGSAHLHPNYAMTLFRRVLGTTIGAYLTRWRVAEAQRLLLTTAATTSDIAAAAGFGSPSSFYAAFGRACGQPPGSYRRSHGRGVGSSGDPRPAGDRSPSGGPVSGSAGSTVPDR